MANIAVKFVIDKLKEQSTEFGSLFHNCQPDLEQLQIQLEGLLLENVQQTEFDGEVKSVVYEIEEMVDSFVTCQKSRSRLLHRLGLSHLHMKSFIQNRLMPFISRIRRTSLFLPTLYGGGQTTKHQINKSRRQGNVVGLEDEFATLLHRVNQESDGLAFIPIVGVQGIGKTTMAMRIYSDPSIQYGFPFRIWVDVSQHLNIRDICLTIMKTFTTRDCSTELDHELILMVNEYLQIGKFLLVVNGVWTTEAWGQIQTLLPMSNKRGKVLITTHAMHVAACIAGEPHLLRLLSDEESWELLQLQAFGFPAQCSDKLDAVGRNIASNSKGLPIANVIIGGVLLECFQRAQSISDLEAEWRKISEDVDTYLSNVDPESTASTLLSWSYSLLPHDLKDCFLYVGVFPEHAEIPVKKLTQLWIAEGLISKDTQWNLEETAGHVLNYLINRNLLTVSKINIYGETKICRVHNIIREFCKREARDVKHPILFQEVVVYPNGLFQPPITDLYNSRGLCIHSDILKFFALKPKLGKTRSFLCFSKYSVSLSTVDASKFSDPFILVRVFDANVIFPKIPTKLIRMIHLRYLTLSVEKLRVLPKAITELWNLHILVVVTSSRTLKIEADIWKMKHLRHLKTKASIHLNKGKGEGGENLQTLTKLSPHSCGPLVFKKAKNLKKLGIRGKLSESMSFSDLRSVEKLTLLYDVYPEVQSETPLNKLPNPNNFPPRVRFLMLSGTYLEWKHMSTLGEICTLEVLKLKDNAFTGSSWDVAIGGFRNLEALSIETTNLKIWTTSSNSFGKLKTLEIRRCERLVQIPINLEKTLEKLCMERVTLYAVSSAMKIEQKRAGKGEFKLIIAPEDMPPGSNSKLNNQNDIAASEGSSRRSSSPSVPLTIAAPEGSSRRTSSPSVPLTPHNETKSLDPACLKRFEYIDLKIATRNFHPDSALGEGGFGRVFKGWIDEHTFKAAKPGTGTVVAIKILNLEGYQGHKEWLIEINHLGTLYHPNLVKLIGYCLVDEHCRLLVYEFMSRGSLENHLFWKTSHYQPISWNLRMKVAYGAAQGLAYLHSPEAKVIYRNFKMSNILIDANYNAKLSDFGLAKDGPMDGKSHVSTRVMGTHGYAAPEYMATGHLTARSDVYSFGVVLLEILTGRRVLDKNRPHGEHNLIDWAKPYLGNKRRVLRIMDARIEDQYSPSMAFKAASLAVKCLSLEPKYRPSMIEVVKALELIQDTESFKTEETRKSRMQDSTAKENDVNQRKNRLMKFLN